MPPALTDSEDETSDNMVKVSAQKNKNGKKVNESADEDAEEEVLNVESADEKDGEDDGEEDEEMYTVEKIITHQFDKDGQLLFKIKWEGYERASDQTWEPEENLDTAKDLVEEYFDSLGGREKVMSFNKKGGKAGAKRGRQSNVDTPASTKKAKATSKSVTRSATPEPQFQPPSGSWEEEVKAIDAAEGAQGQVQVYITWRDGHKTQHPLDVCYKRCPQKMLKFFESHLVFKKA